MSTVKVSESIFFRTLDALRRARKESITDVASVCGVSAPAVHGWRKGGMPTPDKLRLLADHYQCDVGYLLGQPPIRAVCDPPAVADPPASYSPDHGPPAPPCAGCTARDTRIAYLESVVADQARSLRDASAAMLHISAGVCRYPQDAAGPTAPGAPLQKTG